MIVYKDKLTGDEIISDNFPQIKGDTPGLFEVNCSMVTVNSDDIKLEGANASAEEAEETMENTSKRVLDIVDQFRLQEMGKVSKKSAQADYKTYLKALSAKIKETEGEEKQKAFQSKAAGALKKILASWDDYDVYVGESSMGETCMWVLVNYREDGVTPYATIWEDGLDEVKY